MNQTFRSIGLSGRATKKVLLGLGARVLLAILLVSLVNWSYEGLVAIICGLLGGKIEDVLDSLGQSMLKGKLEDIVVPTHLIDLLFELDDEDGKLFLRPYLEFFSAFATMSKISNLLKNSCTKATYWDSMRLLGSNWRRGM